MYRIGGSLGNMAVRSCGDALGIPPLGYWNSNLRPLAGWGTLLGGQFDWGGRLQKRNGGAQRLAQNGWKPFIECKRGSQLDCETDRSSRYESRS